MDLYEQLRHLDKVLLSTVETTFPDTLTEEEKAATHAYLVLCHAVLEEHLEKAFQTHYDRLSSWLVADMVPLEAARLTYAIREWLPKNLEVPYKKRDIRGQAHAARPHIVTRIKHNNGIKPENVEALTRLLGTDWKAFEDALYAQLADLKTLGVKRGEAGHLSPYTDQGTALTWRDYPENVREWVLAGHDAVTAIVDYLERLIREHEPASLITDWDGN